MRNQTKSSKSTAKRPSCIACVRKTTQVLVNLYGIDKVRSVSHDSFYGYMLQYSPVKPYEFNARTIERALREVSKTYESLQSHLAKAKVNS